jgi:broad specificity phosphatase PhoE
VTTVATHPSTQRLRRHHGSRGLLSVLSVGWSFGPDPVSQPATGLTGPKSLPGLRAPWSDVLVGEAADSDRGGFGASRLVAARHGSTSWSASRQHTGLTDIPLDVEGRAEAIELGRRLAGHDFRLVLTSPLLRARTTSELCGFGAFAQVLDDLREWDYGEMEGRTTEEIRKEMPGWDIWKDGVVAGESLHDVARRADRVISLVQEAPGDVLVFAHAHILRIIGARWVGLSAEMGRMLTLLPATLSILGWERQTPAIICWNDTPGDPL